MSKAGEEPEDEKDDGPVQVSKPTQGEEDVHTEGLAESEGVRAWSLEGSLAGSWPA